MGQWREARGSKIQNFCGHHLWKPPKGGPTDGLDSRHLPPMGPVLWTPTLFSSTKWLRDRNPQSDRRSRKSPHVSIKERIIVCTRCDAWLSVICGQSAGCIILIPWHACVFVTSPCLNPSLLSHSLPFLLYPPTHSKTRYSQTALRGISPSPTKGFTQDATRHPVASAWDQFGVQC